MDFGGSADPIEDPSLDTLILSLLLDPLNKVCKYAQMRLKADLEKCKRSRACAREQQAFRPRRHRGCGAEGGKPQLSVAR